jgi:hypothetical protein
VLIESIRDEFLRYKALAEAAIGQLEDAELGARGRGFDNSIAVICAHVAGNLRSRFSDFLTSDGEKPWRDREDEFRTREVNRTELLQAWDDGWSTLLETLAALSDNHLPEQVTIRQQPLSVHEALHRSLAHTAYHVGQIVFIAKSIRGANWEFLSIPPGASNAYKQAPRDERAAAHIERLSKHTQR